MTEIVNYKVIRFNLYIVPYRMSLHKKEHSGVKIQASDNKRSLVFRDWSHGAFAFYLTNSALLDKRVLSQNKTLLN